MFKNWKANNAKRADFSGETIQIPRSRWGYLRDLRLYGKSVQNGEPTPDNPVEIKTVPSELDITSCGKNLYDYFNSTIANHLTGLTREDYGFVAVGAQTDPNSVVSYYNGDLRCLVYGLQPYIDYTLYFDIEMLEAWEGQANTFSYGILLDNDYYAPPLIHGNSAPTRQIKLDFQIPREFTKSEIVFRFGGKKLKISNIMIAPQSASADFVPYLGSTTPITLRDTDGNLHTLKSLPDGTRDEIDVESGKIIKRVKKLTVTSGVAPFNWTYLDASSASDPTDKLCTASFVDTTILGGDYEIDNSVFCNIAKAGYSVPVQAGMVWAVHDPKGLKIVMVLEKSELETLDNNGVRAWIAAQSPFEIMYEGAEPKPWTLHPDEQKKIQTVQDEVGNVFTNAEVQPTISANAISYGG